MAVKLWLLLCAPSATGGKERKERKENPQGAVSWWGWHVTPCPTMCRGHCRSQAGKGEFSMQLLIGIDLNRSALIIWKRKSGLQAYEGLASMNAYFCI